MNSPAGLKCYESPDSPGNGRVVERAWHLGPGQDQGHEHLLQQVLQVDLNCPPHLPHGLTGWENLTEGLVLRVPTWQYCSDWCPSQWPPTWSPASGGRRTTSLDCTMKYKMLRKFLFLIPHVGADGGENEVIVVVSEVAGVKFAPVHVETLEWKSVSEGNNVWDKNVNLPEISLFYRFSTPIDQDKIIFSNSSWTWCILTILPVVINHCYQLLSDVPRIIKMMRIQRGDKLNTKKR